MKILLLSVFIFSRIVLGFDPQKHKNWELLEHNICGEAESERIIGGEEAPMNAYPWIARIGYTTTKTESIVFRCGGVVANVRTVLTAAHCVTNLPQGFEIHTVRFGEHNIDTNPDCQKDFCADPVVDVKPSEVIIPNNYNTPTFKHDLALIRLETDLKFTSFIKPICFPYGELYKKDLVGITAEVAGWGIYDIEKPKASTVLQVVKLLILSTQKCKRYIPGTVDIGPTQLCVGGTIGKDSCGGDSGGPLMKVDDGMHGPRYFLLGIVSFGSKKCGKTEVPGIYTKMSAYMEWFLNNLKEKTSDSLKIL